MALQNLVEVGMTTGQAAKQLGTARSAAYRLAKESTQQYPCSSCSAFMDSKHVPSGGAGVILICLTGV